MKPITFHDKKGAALRAALARDIAAGHKRNNTVKSTRKFPDMFQPVEMAERTDEEGTVHIYYKGDPHVSNYQAAEYIRRFCELNHLTQ